MGVKKLFIINTPYFIFDGYKKKYLKIVLDESGKYIEEMSSKMLRPKKFFGIIYSFEEYIDERFLEYNYLKGEYSQDWIKKHNKSYKPYKYP